MSFDVTSVKRAASFNAQHAGSGWAKSSYEQLSREADRRAGNWFSRDTELRRRRL